MGDDRRVSWGRLAIGGLLRHPSLAGWLDNTPH